MFEKQCVPTFCFAKDRRNTYFRDRHSDLSNFFFLVMKNATWLPATDQDIGTIRKLAHEIWPATFGKILTKEQIDYMLNWMYSEATLLEKQAGGHPFFVLRFQGRPVGFAHLEHHVPEKKYLRLHKLYLHPSCQGIGLGRLMLNHIEEYAKEHGMSALHLNVNRFNRSVAFYERCGFEITAEEDIDIGEGYLMEDFQMIKPLA